jgi:NhaA family Na+:H+ antiporter
MPPRSSPPPSPPEAWKPLLHQTHRIRRPLERFLHIEAASGIILLVATAVALVWVNSPWSRSYFGFWHAPIGIRLGPFEFEHSLEWFVNDGLMAVFFFVAGMEIRREIHQGELSEWRRAALPIAAALGGMVAPAALYLILANDPATRNGWGVSMATDIAFAVGVLTLLGKRVPAALRVLLLALAVIDDLGAILVIALFYSPRVSLPGLWIAAGGIAGIFLMQALGVRRKLAYVLPATVAWAGVYKAGIHPTVAGVLVGFMTPVRAWFGPEGFLHIVQRQLDRLSPRVRAPSLDSHDLAGTLRNVSEARREALSPAESLIETLHPWVAFGIMPVFALANAGVSLRGVTLEGPSVRVAAGVAIGLLVGKPLGILLVSALALRLGLARLPAGLGARHLLVLGLVAGIGFTMALFIARLAFAETPTLVAARLGVLGGSAAAMLLALLCGRLLLAPGDRGDVAQTADEAENSTEL